MLPAERRRQIVEIVQNKGQVRTNELVKRFGASPMTIYRDLVQLEQEGLLKRTHGGVMLAQGGPPIVPDFRIRISSNIEAKSDIGRKAASLVENGDVIIIEASTTCLHMIAHLKSLDSLTIFTNSPLVTVAFGDCPGIKVISSGGLVSKETMTMVGPSAEAFFQRINATKAFIGANGITLERGVTDPYELEAGIKPYIAEACERVYVLADSSKFGKISTYTSLPITDITAVITEEQENNAYLAQIREAGIECIVAEKSECTTLKFPLDIFGNTFAFPTK